MKNLKKVVRVVLYGPAISQSDSRKASPYQLPFNKTDNLHAIVIDIFKLCIENNIQLFPEWIPRSPNQLAKWISKNIGQDDYMLHPNLFVTLDILWGPHTI